MKSSLSTDLNLIFKMTDKWVDFIHTLVKLCWKHIRKKSAGRVVHTWAKKSTHLCPQIERGVDVTNILNGSSVPWNANQRMYFPYMHIYLCILYILLYIQILYEYIVIYSYINIYKASEFMNKCCCFRFYIILYLHENGKIIISPRNGMIIIWKYFYYFKVWRHCQWTSWVILGKSLRFRSLSFLLWKMGIIVT